MLMKTTNSTPSRPPKPASHSEDLVIELPESSLNDETTILPAVKENNRPDGSRYDLAPPAEPQPDQGLAARRLRIRLSLAIKAIGVALVILAWISALYLAFSWA